MLNTQHNFSAYQGPEDVDFAFIEEGSNDKEHNSTSKESITASSSNARISEYLIIIPVTTISYSKNEKEILTVLIEHYRELNFFVVRFTWLCIHKLYRIMLVACNTFIIEPIYRLCIMTLFLLIVSIVNSLVKPYNDPKANYTAFFSYAANLCLAMLNLFKTGLVTFDCKTNCSFQETVLWYFDLVETVLLSYVPCMFMAVWFMYKVVQKCVPKDKND